MSKRSLKFLLQAGISLAALFVLLRMGSPAQALAALLKASLPEVLTAIGLWGVIQVLNVLKWQWVNALQGVAIPWRPLASAYLVGMFFNTFLPSSFGGDAVRAYKLARYSGETGQSVGSVVIDRYLALHSLLVVSAVAMAFSPEMRSVVSWPMLAAALVGGSLPFALPALLALPAFTAWRTRFGWLGRTVEVLSTPEVPRRVVGIWGLAVVTQYLNAVMHYFLILAIGQAISLPYVLAFVPVMVLLSSLPLSVNGLGIREGTLVVFLGQVGIGAPQALAVGVLSLSMLLLVGAVGAVVYLAEGARMRSAHPSPQE